MTNKQPFKNQTILITGASSGLGSEFARQLVQAGANLGLIARRESHLKDLADQISETGQKVAFAIADVGDRDLLNSAISEIKTSLKIERFDRVILNAGVGKTFRAKDFNAQILEEMTRINFFGAANTIEAVLPAMIQSGAGHIIGISSLSARRGLPLGYAYGASKSALTTMLEGLRVELKPLGVNVTVIHPGFIRTPMTENQITAQPGLLDADDAVSRMLNAIAANRLQFNFPAKTTILTETIRRLPARISDMLVSQFVLKAVNRSEQKD
jgi:short-subunit dehydrogenase